jgi:hypothetical protein
LGTVSNRRKNREAQQNQIGDDTELGVFDDFKLEQNIDRLASEEEMMREVENSMNDVK